MAYDTGAPYIILYYELRRITRSVCLYWRVEQVGPCFLSSAGGCDPKPRRSYVFGIMVLLKVKDLSVEPTCTLE